MRLFEYWKLAYSTAKMYRQAWWEMAQEYPLEMCVSMLLAIILAYAILAGANFLGRKIRR